VWNAFLRGQFLIIAFVILVYSILFGALGLRYFFGLAIIAGLARFLPYIGPFIAWTTYGLVAYFQGPTIFGFSPLVYALFVVGIAWLTDVIIDNFISTRNSSNQLPVHALKGKEPYYLGAFLVGAYQEILGDLHNLFGDTNAVHVSVDEDGYKIDQVIDGETVAEVLDYVQYNSKKMVRTVESWVTTSVKAGIITLEEGKEFLSNYRSGLYGYTYLE